MKRQGWFVGVLVLFAAAVAESGGQGAAAVDGTYQNPFFELRDASYDFVAPSFLVEEDERRATRLRSAMDSVHTQPVDRVEFEMRLEQFETLTPDPTGFCRRRLCRILVVAGGALMVVGVVAIANGSQPSAGAETNRAVGYTLALSGAGLVVVGLALD